MMDSSPNNFAPFDEGDNEAIDAFLYTAEPDADVYLNFSTAMPGEAFTSGNMTHSPMQSFSIDPAMMTYTLQQQSQHFEVSPSCIPTQVPNVPYEERSSKSPARATSYTETTVTKRTYETALEKNTTLKSEEVGDAARPPRKKPRGKPCDRCHNKKISCDHVKPNCGNCKRFNIECTFVREDKRRGPTARGFVGFSAERLLGFLMHTEADFEQRMIEKLSQRITASGTTSLDFLRTETGGLAFMGVYGRSQLKDLISEGAKDGTTTDGENQEQKE